MKKNYQVGDLIYDANVYDGMNTDMTDLPFYLRWLPKHPNAKILELCCGTGRLTIPIAKKGYDIIGVDLTPSMLQRAAEKANEAELDIKFIEGDMRTLALDDKFDLIFIPFNSIHHLYENNDLFKTLKTVKQHLNNDGYFLFDCFNPNIQYIVENEKAFNQIASYNTDDDRAVVIKQKMHYESNTQINRIEWHYFINGSFDSIQNLDMRLYFPQELDIYLKSNQFRIVHKFGDFDESPFHANSNKQIFVCQ